MGVRTTVQTTLTDTAISAGFFDRLDRCFAEISCSPAADWQIWEAEPIDEWSTTTKEYVLQRAFRENDAVLLRYVCGGSDDFSLVWIYCSKGAVVERLLIDSMVGAFRAEYTEAERTYALKLQRVSELIHREFGAIETKATVDFQDDPWFRFSKNVWEPIDQLPLDVDHHEYRLTPGQALDPSDSFYDSLDGCLAACDYAPWRARLVGMDSRMTRIEWNRRLRAHTEGSRIFLVYRHELWKSGFVHVLIRFDQDSRRVSELSFDVYLSVEELSHDEIEATLESLSDSLRNAFGGKYFSCRESRYLWRID